GGSRRITEAMAARLTALGGTVTTGVRVTDRAQLSDADIVMLDTSPQAAADILGDAMPRRIARAYRRYRFGPGAYQVALAVEGGVPWTHEASRHAGTVHLGGSDRKSTRLNSSHVKISYAVFCLKKKTT